MNEQMQAMCFFAGANSIFYGEKLLTTSNPETSQDMRLFAKLGIHPLKVEAQVSDDVAERALERAVDINRLDALVTDAAAGRRVAAI